MLWKGSKYTAGILSRPHSRSLSGYLPDLYLVHLPPSRTRPDLPRKLICSIPVGRQPVSLTPRLWEAQMLRGPGPVLYPFCLDRLYLNLSSQLRLLNRIHQKKALYRHPYGAQAA